MLLINTYSLLNTDHLIKDLPVLSHKALGRSSYYNFLNNLTGFFNLKRK